MTSPAFADTVIILNESSNLNQYSPSDPSQTRPVGLSRLLRRKRRSPSRRLRAGAGTCFAIQHGALDLVLGMDDVRSLTKRKWNWLQQFGGTSSTDRNTVRPFTSHEWRERSKQRTREKRQAEEVIRLTINLSRGAREL
jgi:hypothetical protein